MLIGVIWATRKLETGLSAVFAASIRDSTLLLLLRGSSRPAMFVSLFLDTRHPTPTVRADAGYLNIRIRLPSFPFKKKRINKISKGSLVLMLRIKSLRPAILCRISPAVSICIRIAAL